MAIKFACPTCQEPYTVSDKVASKKTICPKCGQKIEVPTPERLQPKLGKIQPEVMAFAKETPAPPPLVRKGWAIAGMATMAFGSVCPWVYSTVHRQSACSLESFFSIYLLLGACGVFLYFALNHRAQTAQTWFWLQFAAFLFYLLEFTATWGNLSSKVESWGAPEAFTLSFGMYVIIVGEVLLLASRHAPRKLADQP